MRMIEIRYGGSGEIKSKKLEDAQEIIIRARTSNERIVIDSNFVMCLINEILENRKKHEVEEFILEEEAKLDPTIELRKVIPPKEKKKPKTEVVASSNDYWLANAKNRKILATFLIFFIGSMLFYIFGM
jgi:hypothetical protein